MPAPSPQSGPPGPQNSPQGQPPGPQGQQPPGQQSSGQSNAIQELVKNIQMGLEHLENFLQSSQGASPQEKQAISQISQAFDQLVGGGGDDDSQDPGKGAQGQTAPMEAGGNKNAMPSPV